MIGYIIGRFSDQEVVDAFERCICSGAEKCPGCYQDGPGFGIECRKQLCRDALFVMRKYVKPETK